MGARVFDAEGEKVVEVAMAVMMTDGEQNN